MGGVAKNWISIDRSQKANYQIHLSNNSKLNMFKDSTVECIYSSHMIEHMKIDDDLNGKPDRWFYDENDDGKYDAVAYDYDQDGEYDKFEKIS